MATHKLKAVPEPEPQTRTVIASETAPAIEGVGDVSYSCGGCDTILLDGVIAGQVVNVVLKCPQCGTFSEI